MDTESQEGLELPWVNTSHPFLKTPVHFKCWVKKKAELLQSRSPGSKTDKFGPQTLGYASCTPRGRGQLWPRPPAASPAGWGKEEAMAARSLRSLRDQRCWAKASILKTRL